MIYLHAKLHGMFILEQYLGIANRILYITKNFLGIDVDYSNKLLCFFFRDILALEFPLCLRNNSHIV